MGKKSPVKAGQSFENGPTMQVIVQAGGKGSRLEHYCWNKPKCLVPVDGKPLLYHLFERFPKASFQVIAEHKAEVLERYVKVFPPTVATQIVRPEGQGTCGGIAQCLDNLGDDESFWLLWSDLRLQRDLPEPQTDKPVIFLSSAFPCRWSAKADENGRMQLVEERSDTKGVMGLFWFPNKSFLQGLSHEGEFVQWLSKNLCCFELQTVEHVVELGTLNALLNHWDGSATTRFYNRITYKGTEVLKEAVIPEYAKMLNREVAWYDQVSALGFKNVPELISRSPLILRRIDGRHPYALPWGAKGRRHILENILNALDSLHSLGTEPSCDQALHDIYYVKTLDRLKKIRALVPEIETVEAFQINGVSTPNILHPSGAFLLDDAMKLLTCGKFTVIHGDPTFSNTLIDDEDKPWFIDPRGSFAKDGVMGDPYYDWAKVYYSVVGNYDNFNRRQFILSQDGTRIEIEIRESGWAHLKDLFRERFGEQLRGIRIRHALIWLALSGWVDDDYDSILAAYFNGICHLRSALSE